MRNLAMHLKNLLSFASYMIICISLTTGQTCYDTGNFSANDIYAINRNLTLSSLASNVSINGGFYHTTIGQDPHKVHGLALCRGDYSLSDCTKCVASVIADIMIECPNQKEALAWEGGPSCLIHYADRSIFGNLDLLPMKRGYNTINITSNLTDFDRIWKSLMDRTVERASAGTSRLKYATEEANLSVFQKIYALMQCTPDLTQSDCNICLRQNVQYYDSCCYGKQGGYVLRPNCILRWDLYPFYNTSIAIAPSPSPARQTNTTITEPTGSGGIASRTVVIAVLCTVTLVVLVAFTCVFLGWRKHGSISKENRNDLRLLEASLSSAVESLQFDFSTIRVATSNFSIDNKLGQGGFGAVYKGRLADGREIAVKRLSRNSGQGEVEFKNALNGQASTQKFDPIKRSSLNWEMCYKIILGIARGIVYLHEDSRLRIIHRDLKASNILLDADMNPKISDFGMAKLFEINQTEGDTNRIVGTFGYMAPEYVKYGQFSIKSDVFSFGVLLLEIISGQKNRDFRNGETDDFLTYAWKNWKAGTAFNLIDNILRDGSTSHEILKCIHIGLLCVQENVTNRPTMASVVLMLTSSSISLPLPSEPAFYMHTNKQLDNLQSTMYDQSKSHSIRFSVNEVSITQMDPR